MTLPVSVPYTFGNTTTQNSLPNLDTNFSTIYTAVNGIGNGTNSLSNSVVTATGSTTSRTLGARAADVVNVLDWGADPTGVLDSTAAFQAALNSTSGGNKGVIVPAGVFLISSTLTSSGSFLSLVGAGPNATYISFNSTTADLFNFSGNFIKISGIGINPTSAMSAGTMFVFSTTSGNIWIDQVFASSGFNFISFTGAGAAQTFITNSVANNLKGTGINYGSSYGGFGFISSLTMSNPGNSNLQYGVLCQNGGTFEWANVNVQSFGTQFAIVPPSGSVVHDVFAVNCLADGVGNSTQGGNGWFVNGGSTSSVFRVYLSNCWGGSNYQSGFFFEGVSDVTISNCIAITNIQHGFYLGGSPTPVSLDFVNCTAYGNNFTSSGAYDGIRVDNYVSQFSIKGCMVTAVQGTTNNQQYGINISGTNHDYYVVTDNICYSNATGSIKDQGAGVNKFVRSNIGYNPLARTSVSVTSSPFSWSNNTGETVLLSVSGGTVSNVSVDSVLVSSATGCVVTVSQGKTAVITYSSTPTISYAGL